MILLNDYLKDATTQNSALKKNREEINERNLSKRFEHECRVFFYFNRLGSSERVGKGASYKKISCFPVDHCRQLLCFVRKDIGYGVVIDPIDHGTIFLLV